MRLQKTSLRETHHSVPPNHEVVQNLYVDQLESLFQCLCKRLV